MHVPCIAQIEVTVSDDVTALVFRHLQALSRDDLTRLEKYARDYNQMIYLQSGGMETISPLWQRIRSCLIDWKLLTLPYHFYPRTSSGPAAFRGTAGHVRNYSYKSIPHCLYFLSLCDNGERCRYAQTAGLPLSGGRCNGYVSTYYARRSYRRI